MTTSRSKQKREITLNIDSLLNAIKAPFLRPPAEWSIESPIEMVYNCTKATSLSSWSFDPIWMEPGETATLRSIWTSNRTNPLWKVRRDKDGAEKSVLESVLIEHGAIAYAPDAKFQDEFVDQRREIEIQNQRALKEILDDSQLSIASVHYSHDGNVGTWGIGLKEGRYYRCSGNPSEKEQEVLKKAIQEIKTATSVLGF